MPFPRLLALLGVAFSAASTAHATGIDFVVFQDGSGVNALVVAKPDQVDEPYPIRPADVEELAGFFLTIEPGWDGLGVDQSAEDRSALLNDSGVLLRRVSFDPGFSMYDLDFNSILEADGDTVLLVGEPEVEGFLWHQHLVFGVEPGTPVGESFSATFVVSDPTGEHADSEPFTLTFITAPQVVVGDGASPRAGLCGYAGIIAPLGILLGLAGFKTGLRRREARFLGRV